MGKEKSNRDPGVGSKVPKLGSMGVSCFRVSSKAPLSPTLIEWDRSEDCRQRRTDKTLTITIALEGQIGDEDPVISRDGRAWLRVVGLSANRPSAYSMRSPRVDIGAERCGMDTDP